MDQRKHGRLGQAGKPGGWRTGCGNCAGRRRLAGGSGSIKLKKNIYMFNRRETPKKRSISAGHDFTVKGFHINLRIQVMPLPALKAFVRELAGFGINTLVSRLEVSV